VDQDSPQVELRELQERATAKAAFGEPIQAAGRTVIPVASVAWFGGYGRGKPLAKMPPVGTPGQEGESSGRRLRIASRVRPLAVVEVSDDGVRLRRVTDTTAIVLGAFAMAAWNVFWVALTLRSIFGRSR
jgi:uncharacterized spore protein YtfJ